MSSSSTGSGPVSLPLQIATAFTKQYYNIRSCNNPFTHKFYKSESRVSFSSSRGASATTWILGELDAHDRESRFSWAANSRVDFTNGSIDAQESTDGGVLVVVTAEMYSESLPERKRSFVQTFVLKDGNHGGPRKNYYVFNDVLRFLDEEDDRPPDAVGVEETNEVVAEEDDSAPPPPASLSLMPPSPPENNASLLDNGDAEQLAGAYRVAAEEQRRAVAENERISSDNNVQQQQQQQHKPPGSWASLVAGSSVDNNGNDLASSDAPPVDKPTDGDDDDDAVKDNDASGNVRGGGGGSAGYGSKGSSSLYVKNVGENTTEADLRKLFSEYPFKIVNVSFYPSRGYAFVDFADANAVSSIMSESSRRTFHMNGRTIEVEKKSARKPNARRPDPRYHKDRRRGGGGGRGVKANKRNNVATADNDVDGGNGNGNDNNASNGSA